MELELWSILVICVSILYVAVCFGMVAGRTGRNPYLWGIMSVISPLNTFILGYWALTGHLPFGDPKPTKIA